MFTDEISTLTELATDDGGGRRVRDRVGGKHRLRLEPLNAVAEARPWHRIRRNPSGSKYFHAEYPRSVRVTGKFGWAQPPEAVKVATGIIATKILRRARSAPMGIVTAFDGTAVRMSRFDPQVDELLALYNLTSPFA